jgi:hypothetical protein
MNFKPFPILASFLVGISGCTPQKLLIAKCSLQAAERTLEVTVSAPASEGIDALMARCGRAYISLGTGQHPRVLRIPNKQEIIVQPYSTTSISK